VAIAPARPATTRAHGKNAANKLALLTWLGAYGVITLILAVLGPAIAKWPAPC
jgi:antibiotic biosynthesis monooxygenase (ABM) superfamily enzyme